MGDRRVPVPSAMSDPQRKRRRPPISCALCRSRKIRCDRGNPCNNCLKSRNGTCVYVNQPSQLQQQQLSPVKVHQWPTPASSIGRESTVPSQSTLETSSTSASPLAIQPIARHMESMECRIRRLEEELSKTPQRSAQSHVPTSDADIETTRTKLAETCTIYKTRMYGQSHSMNGVRLFQDLFEGIAPHFRAEKSKAFSGIQRCKSLAKTIKSQRRPPWPSLAKANLPPKEVADELVECYLRTSEALYRVLHIPTFRTDYDAFWVSDTDPDATFLIQLKLVLSIGAITYDDHFSLRTSAIHWVHEAIHWLSKPDFKSRLNIQSIQTDILLLLARESVNVGGELVWISAGALFRTAVCIGLHRDPAHLSKRTGLAAEMRRRLWNTILEIVLQTSLISGAPPFFSLEDFDTEPPQNFDDDQLVAEDPIPKSDNLFTQSSVAIAVRKTFPLRITITKFLNDLGSSGTYEETLRLDTDLRTSYKVLRQTLQAFKSNTLPSPSHFQIRAIDILINHALCSIHVPFLGRAMDDTAYAFSTKVVLETSLKVWCTTYPSSPQTSIDTDSSTLDDLTRFAVCSSGFFRTAAFQASLLIVVSLKTQLQEEESTGPVPLGPDLFSVLEDAKSWSLRMIKAGETNIKWFLLMSIVCAQLQGLRKRWDETERHVPESQSLMMKVTEEAEETCLAVLQEMAERGQKDAETMASGLDPSALSMPSEAMQEWNFMNPDSTFELGGSDPMSWLYGNGNGQDSLLW